MLDSKLSSEAKQVWVDIKTIVKMCTRNPQNRRKIVACLRPAIAEEIQDLLIGARLEIDKSKGLYWVILPQNYDKEKYYVRFYERN